jgi:hypothetical protein
MFRHTIFISYTTREDKAKRRLCADLLGTLYTPLHGRFSRQAKAERALYHRLLSECFAVLGRLEGK